MTKTDKKIISIFLLLIMIIAQLSPVFAADYAGQEKVEYENLTEYIEKKGCGYFESNDGGYYISIGDAIIKDFSDISNYNNINKLYLDNVDIGNVDNIQIPLNVKEIWILGKFNGTLSLNENHNLRTLSINEQEKGDLASAVIDIRGLKDLTTFNYTYIGSEKIKLEEKILMDYYGIVKSWVDTVDGVEKNIVQFHTYENFSDYWDNSMHYDYENKDDVKQFAFKGLLIKDISDIYQFQNLEELWIEDFVVYDGNYSFSNNKKLKSIDLKFAMENFENVVFDIRNMDCLNYFSIGSDVKTTGFEPEKNVVIDDGKIIYGKKNDDGSFHFVYSAQDNKPGTQLTTLEQYLIENGVDGDGDGVLSDAEWAKVKNLDLTNVDLTGIEKAVNLKKMWISEGCSLDNVDFSKLAKLETLYLYDVTLTDNAQNNIGKASNLKSLGLVECMNYTKIDYSGLQKLTDLYMHNCKDNNTSYKFPSIPSLIDLSFTSYDEVYIDFSELANVDYLRVSLMEGTAKFPKFSDLKSIDVYNPNYEGGLVKVDGNIDLSSCDDIWGSLMVDSSKLVLNSKTLYSKYEDEVRLDTIDYEIDIMKGEKYTLTTGTQIYKLIQNDNSNVATFKEVCLDETENIMSCEIIANNVGSANIKIKDELGHETTLKVKVFDKSVNGEVDTTLENTGVTAEFVADCEKILKSNGELWEVNSSTTAEKVETNVKDYVGGWVYSLGAKDTVYVSNLLKSDGKLKIEYEDTVKEVSNVKQIEDKVYLTNDGKLYETGLNYITEEINPKLIKENVKKLINECIVLEDGTTWFQNYDRFDATSNVVLEKLADFEIKDMSYYEYQINEWSSQLIPTVIDLNNVLWCSKDMTYYFSQDGLEKLMENFEGYELQPHGGFYGIDGITILENGDAVSRYYDYEEGKYVNGSVILSNVSQAYYNNAGDGHVIIRTDGTIWTYNDTYGLTKITKSTSFDDEDKEEEKEFLTPTTQVNSKELGTSTMISGISNNTNVQNFMKQNNFNNAYQAKIFDKNNNEITGESLLGTGSTVKLYEDGKVVKEYVVVIYGDTTGDGKITAVDALAIIKHINNKILFTKDAYTEAGRVRTTSGTTLTSVDALAIIKGVNGKFTINQDK